MVRLACGLAAALWAAPALATSPDPAALTVPPEQAARARELVRLLGSDTYPDRARASRELEKMGRLALAALTDAARDPDPEVRLRTGLLLPRAEADDLRVRIDTFLADADGRYDHDLPGWRPFRLVAGDDRAARDLFAAIVKKPTNHDLLLALRGVPPDARPGLIGLAGGLVAAGAERPPAAALGRAVVECRRAIYVRATPQRAVRGGVVNHTLTPPDLPEMALLLLAESLVSERDAPFGSFQYQPSLFFQQVPAGMAAVIGRGTYGPPFRRLALNWLDTRDGAAGVENARNVALNLNLNLSGPVMARYAAKLLRTPGVPRFKKPLAIAQVARYGGRAYLGALTALFGDDSAPFAGGVPNAGEPEILMRDVALAMAVLATDQDPKAYGFEVLSGNPAMKYAETNYQFPPENADAARSRGFARWREWEAGLHAAAAGTAAAHPAVARRYPELPPAGGEKKKD